MPRIKKQEPQGAAPAAESTLPLATTTTEAHQQPSERKELAKEGALLTLQDYKGMSLWQALQRMTEEDWSDKMLYINRVQPFTVNKTSGEKYGSLDKGKFVGWTEEMFRSRFGGGRFHLWLKRGRDTCAEATPQWDGDIKLLVDEELKARLLPAAGAQPAAGEETAKVVKMFLDEQRRQREEAGDDDGVEVLDNAIELMSKASEKAIEIAAGGRGNGGIAELTTAMKTMHDMIKPSEQISLKDLMEFGLKVADKLTKPSAGQNPEKPHNPIDEMRNMMALMRELREESGGVAAAPSRDDWKMQLVAAGMQLIQNLPAIMQQQRQSQLEQFQMMLAGRALHGQVGMPGMPAMAPGPVGTPSGPAAAPAAAFAGPAAGVAARDPLTEIKQNVVRMFKEGDEGTFAARMIQVVNPMLYKALSTAPKDDIMKFIAQDEVLREIADSPDLPQFLKEMVQYFEEEAKPQTEAQPAEILQ
jgi:hypothetical protein